MKSGITLLVLMNCKACGSVESAEIETKIARGELIATMTDVEESMPDGWSCDGELPSVRCGKCSQGARRH